METCFQTFDSIRIVCWPPVLHYDKKKTVFRLFPLNFYDNNKIITTACRAMLPARVVFAAKVPLCRYNISYQL